MIIANPIFDTVFERLMEDERALKFFIGTLLEKNVVEIRQRKYPIVLQDETEDVSASLLRLDFSVVVEANDDGYEKIRVELQKINRRIDMMRFRNRLVEERGKKDTGAENSSSVTVCLSGFNLPDIDSACIRVGAAECEDLVNKTTARKKSSFLASLKPDTYLIQLKRIVGGRHQTALDKLLSVFEQANFVDGSDQTLKNYDYPSDNRELKHLLGVLNYLASEPEQRREIDRESESMLSVKFHITENMKERNRQIRELSEEMEKMEIEIRKLRRMLKYQQ
jgi:hypothetical protein